MVGSIRSGGMDQGRAGMIQGLFTRQEGPEGGRRVELWRLALASTT